MFPKSFVSPVPLARTVISLRRNARALIHSRTHSNPGPLIEQSKIELPPVVSASQVSGDFSTIGTDSAEYHCVDTDPMSSTSPYEFPETSGRQLRYGGKEILEKPVYTEIWQTHRELKTQKQRAGAG